MSIVRRYALSAGLLALAIPAFAGPRTTTTHTRSHANHAATARKSVHAAAHHDAAVAIPPERATAIQTALIQRGYLSGEPTGVWDAQTVSAMEKLQADNGWQSKITPDARALIKLGLGPAPTQEQETVQTPPQ
jgi:hypothetical protein